MLQAKLKFSMLVSVAEHADLNITLSETLKTGFVLTRHLSPVSTLAPAQPFDEYVVLSENQYVLPSKLPTYFSIAENGKPCVFNMG